MIQLTLKSPTYAWVPILSTYWSYKCFNPYFLDQPVRIFVNGGKFSKQYRKIQMFQMEKKSKGTMKVETWTINWGKKR